MKKFYLFLGVLSVMAIFTQCRTTKTAVDGTTSSTTQKTDEKNLTDSQINSCSYRSSSPFFGRKEWSVTNQHDGHYKVVFKQMTAMGNDMPVELEFITDNQIDKDLHRLFREANLQNCKPTVPDRDMMVHDAPVVSFSVRFDDGTEYNNEKLYEYSPEVNKAMGKADDYILKFVKEHKQ